MRTRLFRTAIHHTSNYLHKSNRFFSTGNSTTQNVDIDSSWLGICSLLVGYWFLGGKELIDAKTKQLKEQAAEHRSRDTYNNQLIIFYHNKTRQLEREDKAVSASSSTELNSPK